MGWRFTCEHDTRLPCLHAHSFTTPREFAGAGPFRPAPRPGFVRLRLFQQAPCRRLRLRLCVGFCVFRFQLSNGFCQSSSLIWAKQGARPCAHGAARRAPRPEPLIFLSRRHCSTKFIPFSQEKGSEQPGAIFAGADGPNREQKAVQIGKKTPEKISAKNCENRQTFFGLVPLIIYIETTVG